jgi:hypothetical protein
MDLVMETVILVLVRQEAQEKTQEAMVLLAPLDPTVDPQHHPCRRVRVARRCLGGVLTAVAILTQKGQPIRGPQETEVRMMMTIVTKG